MRYVYYIIAIVIVLSGLTAYGIFDTKVELSKPFLSVNDRIISKDEFAAMLKSTPDYMSRDQFIESVIERQLLIQQAIKQEVNREEGFRQSVEDFYEQSLVNMLLERKRNSLVVDVTDDELEKYENFLNTHVTITKTRYQTLEDAKAKRNGKSEIIETRFIDLPDDLKFIILNMPQGNVSSPEPSVNGYVTYWLSHVVENDSTAKEKSFDMKKVSIFLQGKKKQELIDEWTRSIRESAQIWREK